ncbi:MAG TPA: CYTH domain-containing protein [Longimicrobiales bacterium]
MIEIERRFLCRVEDPAALAGASRRSTIRQGYLTEGEPAVRIRRRDEEYVLTIKAGRGSVRREVEVPVDADAGAALLAMAGDRRVDKTRYVLGRWEIDVFGGPLEGLVLGEVELHHAAEPLPPPPPGIAIVREVTDEAMYTNQRLAHLDPDAARRLAREGGAAAGPAGSRPGRGSSRAAGESGARGS